MWSPADVANFAPGAEKWWLQHQDTIKAAIRDIEKGDVGHENIWQRKNGSAEMDQKLLDSINKSHESWVAKGWVEPK